MEYRIAQSHKYRGSDYWDWSAWIDAPPAALSEIESVTWLLHPSFSPPRIESRSKKTGFRVDTSGWGTFLLKAELHKKQGSPKVISRMLELTYPDESEAASSSDAPVELSEQAPADRATPYVYMSYSSEDAAPASRAREALTHLGMQVRDAGEINPGLPFDAAVRKMIRECAGVVAVVGSDYASPYVISEMKLAKADEKPALALLPEGVDRPTGLLPDLQELRFSQEPNELKPQLAEFVSSLRRGASQ